MKAEYTRSRSLASVPSRSKTIARSEPAGFGLSLVGFRRRFGEARRLSDGAALGFEPLLLFLPERCEAVVVARLAVAFARWTGLGVQVGDWLRRPDHPRHVVH